mmetsp:Transcript_35574/g.83129  ORF Transcript_35574/g.83129 Transcript_35574/m.83129 type:complete len:230 (+) Transcript_35574:454-1143(+)
MFQGFLSLHKRQLQIVNDISSFLECLASVRKLLHFLLQALQPRLNLLLSHLGALQRRLVRKLPKGTLASKIISFLLIILVNIILHLLQASADLFDLIIECAAFPLHFSSTGSLRGQSRLFRLIRSMCHSFQVNVVICFILGTISKHVLPLQGYEATLQSLDFPPCFEQFDHIIELHQLRKLASQEEGVEVYRVVIEACHANTIVTAGFQHLHVELPQPETQMPAASPNA